MTPHTRTTSAVSSINIGINCREYQKLYQLRMRAARLCTMMGVFLIISPKPILEVLNYEHCH